MNALFGNSNSFLGGMEDDEELPVVIGSTIVDEPGEVVVLVCHSCEKGYGLPDQIDDERLFEMCPRCLHVFSSRAPDEELSPALADG